MSLSRSTRAADEQLLDWLFRRHSGQSTAHIAQASATVPSAVRTATNRVRDADLAESAEPRDVVLRGYCW